MFSIIASVKETKKEVDVVDQNKEKEFFNPQKAQNILITFSKLPPVNLL